MLKKIILFSVTFLVINYSNARSNKELDTTLLIEKAKGMCLLPFMLEKDSIILSKMIVKTGYLKVRRGKLLKEWKDYIVIRIIDTTSSKYLDLDYILCFETCNKYEILKISGFGINNKKMQKNILKSINKKTIIRFQLDYDNLLSVKK